MAKDCIGDEPIFDDAERIICNVCNVPVGGIDAHHMVYICQTHGVVQNYCSDECLILALLERQDLSLWLERITRWREEAESG